MLCDNTLLLFLSASVLLAITPGPDNLYVLIQSAIHNRRVGLLITLGLCTGLVAHSLAIAYGLSAFIAASPLAFFILKLSGAAYIAYLAWRVFNSQVLPLQKTSQSPPRLNYGQFYRRGIIMNITNPKIALFFLAFLPQFVDVNRDSVTIQVMQIGAIFILVTLVVFSIVILLSVPIRQWLIRHPKRQITLNKFSGLLLFFLALYIAFFSV